MGEVLVCNSRVPARLAHLPLGLSELDLQGASELLGDRPIVGCTPGRPGPGLNGPPETEPDPREVWPAKGSRRTSRPGVEGERPAVVNGRTSMRQDDGSEATISKLGPVFGCVLTVALILAEKARAPYLRRARWSRCTASITAAPPFEFDLHPDNRESRLLLHRFERLKEPLEGHGRVVRPVARVVRPVARVVLVRRGFIVHHLDPQRSGMAPTSFRTVSSFVRDPRQECLGGSAATPGAGVRGDGGRVSACSGHRRTPMSVAINGSSIAHGGFRVVTATVHPVPPPAGTRAYSLACTPRPPPVWVGIGWGSFGPGRRGSRGHQRLQVSMQLKVREQSPLLGLDHYRAYALCRRNTLRPEAITPAHVDRTTPRSALGRWR